MKPPVCILGAGRSGIAAARLLAQTGRGQGWVVAEREPDPGRLADFAALGFVWESEGPPLRAQLAVVSPGFAADHPWLQGLRVAGVPLLPEWELGMQHLQGKVFALTGSLGKTTMVMLAAELLRAQGLQVTLSGNIGMPVCEVALSQPQADWHVMELSSFQTELLQAAAPDVAVLLNLYPNHLDRHGSMAAYAAAKLRMFACQRPDQLAVLPPEWLPEAPGHAEKLAPDPHRLPRLQGTAFDVPHLRENLAAVLSALPALPDEAAVTEMLAHFQFPPHRMQQLALPGGVQAIDDSKSTCLSATLAALRSVAGPVSLFMGGISKAEPMGLLADELSRGNVKLYLFGQDGPVFGRAWEGLPQRLSVHPALPEAVETAFLHLAPDEILLFSPGCASFDQYASYSERAEHFQQILLRTIQQHRIQNEVI